MSSMRRIEFVLALGPHAQYHLQTDSVTIPAYQILEPVCGLELVIHRPYDWRGERCCEKGWVVSEKWTGKTIDKTYAETRQKSLAIAQMILGANKAKNSEAYQDVLEQAKLAKEEAQCD